jgi:hypothetical protein
LSSLLIDPTLEKERRQNDLTYFGIAKWEPLHQKITNPSQGVVSMRVKLPIEINILIQSLTTWEWGNHMCTRNKKKIPIFTFFVKCILFYFALKTNFTHKYYIYYFLELCHEIWKIPIFSVIYEKKY